MSWLEFIAQMSNAWAWPIVGFVAFILLRPEIKSAAKLLVGRIGDIAHLKAPGVAIDFKKEVKEFAEATEEMKDEAPRAGTAKGSEDVVLPPETAEARLAKYQQLAAVDPRAAILLPFADLEELIRQKFRELYPEESPTLGFNRMVERFRSDGLLDEDVANALNGLRTIWTQVAHGREGLDVDVANYFIDSVANLIGYLLLTDFFKDKPEPQL